MNARSTVSAALLLAAGSLLTAGPAAAVTYRCDGNLVTDSPTRGTNCVAMGSRPTSATFSTGSADSMIEDEPTAAGRPAANRRSGRTNAQAAGSGTLNTGAARKP